MSRSKRRQHARAGGHKLDGHALTRAFASGHDGIVAEVQAQVDTVRAIAAEYDPVDLMMKCHLHFLSTMQGKFVESEMGPEELTAMRLPEYVQSVIVSTPPRDRKHIDPTTFEKLVGAVQALYTLLMTNYAFSVQAKRREEQGGQLSPLDQVWFHRHMRWLAVRGDRYIERDFEYLREFLGSQSSLLQQKFGLTSEDIVGGIEKLHNAMTQEFNTLLEERDTLIKEYSLRRREIVQTRERRLATHPEEERAVPPLEDELRQVFQDMNMPARMNAVMARFFDGSLLDVIRITGWPEAFAAALSSAPGEDVDFMSGDRPGWPTKVLPIMNRPFLKDGARFYMFEFITFFDHIFHTLREVTTQDSPKRLKRWRDNEKHDTERTTLDILNEMLPGAVSLGTFHYDFTDEHGKTGFAEADGLLLFARHLLLVEVKGGRASHRPPEGPVLSYLKGVEGLVTEPVAQAERFLRELERTGSVVLQDQHRRPMRTLRTDDFDHLYVVTTMLEHLGEYTANLEGATTLRVAQKKLPVWSISIDDLRVVRDLMEAPAEFLHFLDQRMAAHAVSQFALTDELEHVALYLGRNRYAALSREEQKFDKVFYYSLKDGIDEYYRRLKTGETPNPKPRRLLPGAYGELVHTLSVQGNATGIQAAKYLLDFNETDRDTIAEAFPRMLESQQRDDRVTPLHVHEPNPLTVVAFTPGLSREKFSTTPECRRYTLSVMKALRNDRRLMVTVSLDASGRVTDAEPLFLSGGDVDAEPTESLDGPAEDFIRMNPLALKRKIGPNEPCPCGSGKKYKRCHSRLT